LVSVAVSVEAYPGDPDLEYVDGAPCAIKESTAQDQVVVARDLRRRNPVCAEVSQARDLVLELVVAEVFRVGSTFLVSVADHDVEVPAALLVEVPVIPGAGHQEELGVIRVDPHAVLPLAEY